MRPFQRMSQMACLAVVSTVWAPALGEPAPVTSPSTQPTGLSEADSAQHVRTLIAQLDDSDYNLRRKASVQVNSLGADALPLIQAAVRDEEVSPEAQRRLKIALKYIEPRARHETAQIACRDWERRMLHQACAGGKHLDHARDASAEQAIDLFLTLGRDSFHGPPAPRRATLQALDRVLEGAEDPEPMLACLRRIVGGAPSDSDDQPDQHLIARLAAEAYPPGAETVTLLYWLWGTVRPDLAGFQRVATLLPLLAASDELPPTELDVIGNSFYDVCYRENDYSGPALQAFISAYAELRPHEAGPVLLRARQHVDQAGKLFDTGQNELANAQLQAANAELLKAQTIDPADARVGLYMLISLQASNASSDEINLWYERAITADPDNWSLASQKLRFLSRQADAAAMLAFGHECLTTENWRGQIPLILADAHQLLASKSADPDQYWLQPDVWKDLQTLYEAGLANFPDNLRLRSKYALAACRCERWDAANQQFGALRDRFDLQTFGSREMYEYQRDKAQRQAAAAPSTSTKPSE